MEKSISTNNSIQELIGNGGEVPNNYIYKDPISESTNASVPKLNIPVIDLNRLISCSSATTMAEELEKLRTALSSWGCFQVINHGVESLDKMREIAGQFFRLPTEEKLKYARSVDCIEGYGTDMVLYENQTLDWTDRLFLTVTPAEQKKLQYWPVNPKSFRKALEEYTEGIMKIIDVLLRSIAKSLELSENIFKDKCGERPIMTCRFSIYPPCPRPESVLGLKPHADASVITIVLPDKEVEGLQFQKDNQWFRAPIIPHALVVNVGDELEIISNGIIKSPMHRVLTNSEKERVSIAMFWSAEVGKEIEPLDELVDENRPKAFRSVKDFHEMIFKYYQKGLRTIDAVRI